MYLASHSQCRFPHTFFPRHFCNPSHNFLNETPSCTNLSAYERQTGDGCVTGYYFSNLCTSYCTTFVNYVLGITRSVSLPPYILSETFLQPPLLHMWQIFPGDALPSICLFASNTSHVSVACLIHSLQDICNTSFYICSRVCSKSFTAKRFHGSVVLQATDRGMIIL